MARDVSAAFRSSINRPESDDPVLILLELDHFNLANPIRVTSDAVPTTSNGIIYQPYGFEISLPDERVNSLPEMQLRIDNVDQLLVNTVRTVGDGSVSLTVRVVLASAPNTVEVELSNLEIRSVEYDAFVVSGRIASSPILDHAFPAGRFTPQVAPGLFQA